MKTEKLKTKPKHWKVKKQITSPKSKEKKGNTPELKKTKSKTEHLRGPARRPTAQEPGPFRGPCYRADGKGGDEQTVQGAYTYRLIEDIMVSVPTI